MVELLSSNALDLLDFLGLVALDIPGELDKDNHMGPSMLLVKADLGIVEMTEQGSLQDIEAVGLMVEFLLALVVELTLLDIGQGCTVKVVIAALGIVSQEELGIVVEAVLDTIKELNFRPIKDTFVEE